MTVSPTAHSGRNVEHYRGRDAVPTAHFDVLLNIIGDVMLAPQHRNSDMMFNRGHGNVPRSLKLRN